MYKILLWNNLLLSSCHVQLFATPWTPAHQASLSFTVSLSLLKLMSTESVLHQPSHPLLSPSPLSLNLSQHQGLLAYCIRWPEYWSFSFSISPYHQYSVLISLRIDWFNLLVVQGILKSLLQHHSSKASILRHSAFFTVQLSHPHMTTGKIRAVTRWTFVGRVRSLHLNTLSKLIIAFLPRSKCLLISWLQSQSTVILEPKK